RCATTTWRAAGSGTPPSSPAGATTGTRTRAPTNSLRSRSASTLATSWGSPRRSARAPPQVPGEQVALVRHHVREREPLGVTAGHGQAAGQDPVGARPGQHRADGEAQL